MKDAMPEALSLSITKPLEIKLLSMLSKGLTRSDSIKVLHKLVKYSVASQFCFKGQNDEKRCFENTEVKQLVDESLQATPGLRLSEHQINSKIARWLKAAQSKIGKNNGDKEEDLSGDE
ncbi:hypothetical protein DAPPUDRAFT_319806 [Daphnia pulex]|uniref:DUF4806 domain-containing protein n=1 Tax=Daphnia pulex TaxID=6669 RepID=E9GMW5_DAPPU|nr:hypothetical protein DAPPUDRAFT_319806 [Daphnia pulex]|eukprot:EFX79217.1 hypothetical protein DAPPUDRAFT_319806 [Daphnia pulex]